MNDNLINDGTNYGMFAGQFFQQNASTFNAVRKLFDTFKSELIVELEDAIVIIKKVTDNRGHYQMYEIKVEFPDPNFAEFGFTLRGANFSHIFDSCGAIIAGIN